MPLKIAYPREFPDSLVAFTLLWELRSHKTCVMAKKREKKANKIAYPINIHLYSNPIILISYKTRKPGILQSTGS